LLLYLDLSQTQVLGQYGVTVLAICSMFAIIRELQVFAASWCRGSFC